MYIKIIEGTAQRFTLAELRKENPNTSFPKKPSDSLLAEYDVYIYTTQAKPDFNPMTHKIVEDGFSEVDGSWVSTWSVIELLESEREKASKRMIKDYESTIERFMNSKAEEKGYSDIVSACSYAGAPNPFQAEGTAALKWRGDVWAKCYQILADFQAGNRAKPTISELIGELPELVW